jgi:hypothetical protein
VLPYDDLRAAAPALQVRAQRLEGLEHVAVARVPGGDAPLEHRPVVALGVATTRAFCSASKCASSPSAAAGRRSPQLRELRDDGRLARGVEVEARRGSVGLRSLREVSKQA